MKNNSRTMTINERAKAMRDNADMLDAIADVIDQIKAGQRCYMESDPDTGEDIVPSSDNSHYLYIKYKAYDMVISQLESMVANEF